MKQLPLLFLFAIGFIAANANDAFNVTYKKTAQNEMELKFTLGEYKLKQTTINNEGFTQIVFNHSITTAKKGFAALPYLHASLELNNNKNISLVIEEGDYIDYQLENHLIPSKGTIYRNQDPDKIPYKIAPSSIKDSWYPERLAENTEPYILKDKRGVNVYVYPFVYNAKKKVLRVYKTLKIKLIQNQTLSINPIPNSNTRFLPEMEPVYKSVFINHNTPSRDELTLNQYGDMLVITTERDEEAIAPYIEWKQEKGFAVEKEVVATGTNVKELIKQEYEANNNILYVVLVGDWDDIKSDQGPQDGPMDTQLGCVVGTDNVADIIIGRISANSPADVTTQINKCIGYEKNAVANSSWYSAALGIGSAEGGPSWGKGDDNEADTTHQRVIYEDKLSKFTYNTFYQAFDPGASINDVKSAVESGVSIINYTGHGSMTAWGTTDFSNTNVNNLTNGEKTPFIISVACNNGDFHNGTCFAEAWLRKENGGAVAMLAASISQDWDPPMRGQDYINDILTGGYNYDEHEGQNGINTNESRSIIGTAVFNAFILMTSESNNTTDWETVKTWNIFGDPTLQLRTASPNTLSLSNNAVISGLEFSTTITQAGAPVENAQVCISKDNTFYTGITDANGNVNIEHTLQPGEGKLTITAFNALTIYEDIAIASPDGAYVVASNYTINDNSGNANGQLDYNETIILDLTAKNVGTDTAFNVNALLSSNNLHVSLIDNAHSYGTMVSNTTVVGTEAFTLSVSDSVPDQTLLELLVNFTDGNEKNWESKIHVLANAPAFEITGITINDEETGNNDGILDAGETADIELQVTNIGHATSIAGKVDFSSTNALWTLNSTSKELIALAPEHSTMLSFNVTANTDVPFDTPADIICNLTAGKYSHTTTLNMLIAEIPVYLMSNATHAVIVGKFMDTGGLNDNYALNEEYVITFKPKTIGDTIVLDFKSFHIESGYDFMYFYDGLSTCATPIGESYSGTSSPGTIKANNPDGAITVKFTSDYVITAPGWYADIYCIKGISSVHDFTPSVEISMYPNPAKQAVTVSSNTKGTATIYDLSGRIMQSQWVKQGTNTIDISKLKPGNYIFDLKNSKGRVNKKLMVY